MRRTPPTLALLAVLAAAAPGSAAAAAAAVDRARPAPSFAPHQLVVRLAGERRGRALRLPPGVAVRQAGAALRANPRVAYALPNYIATASALASDPRYLVPDDSGTLAGLSSTTEIAGGWAAKQWNFLPPASAAGPELPSSRGGIDAPGAWRNLAAVGRPGARGVTVAVLDSGVAYRGYRQGARVYRPSPDFSPTQFVPGYDFVSRDRLPLDENGHGTHVAGTIAERTDNGVGLTGLAYGAKLMPVRVLDRRGAGEATKIARGIRFAVAHRAQVINMSFNFGCRQPVPVVAEALRQAYRKGVVTVASVGNRHAETCAAPPATFPQVIGVGGTTAGGCLGSYSLAGGAVDLLAPGGGPPIAGCPSTETTPIYQVTLNPNSTSEFSIPEGYAGTSMAAAHVSALAAMVIASGAVRTGGDPRERVRAVARRLRQSARGIGLPRSRQGAGLVDAAAATAPAPPPGGARG